MVLWWWKILDVLCRHIHWPYRKVKTNKVLAGLYHSWTHLLDIFKKRLVNEQTSFFIAAHSVLCFHFNDFSVTKYTNEQSYIIWIWIPLYHCGTALFGHSCLVTWWFSILLVCGLRKESRRKNRPTRSI